MSVARLFGEAVTQLDAAGLGLTRLPLDYLQGALFFVEDIHVLGSFEMPILYSSVRWWDVEIPKMIV